MSTGILVGAILIEEQALMARVLGLESVPCLGNWSLVKALDSFALDRKIHAAGWNFFFMATEVRVMFLGALRAKKVHNALRRILKKVSGEDFNCLEVTGIVAKRFFGLRYATVSAHSRHIQQSCRLDDAQARRTTQHSAEWARG
ncbi:MAG: hypothetical protein WAL32_06285 [Terriglobales bacterium]